MKTYKEGFLLLLLFIAFIAIAYPAYDWFLRPELTYIQFFLKWWWLIIGGAGIGFIVGYFKKDGIVK